MSVPIEVVGYRVLVLPDKAPEEIISSGGLRLIQEGDRKITVGTIVGVSVDIEDCPYDLNDRVVYSPWSGFKITLGREEYLILSIDEILGRLLKEVEVHAE